MSGPEDSGGGGVGGGGGGSGGIDEDEDEIDGPTKRDYPKEESKPTCEGKILSFFKLKDAKKKLVLPERWRRRKKRRRRTLGGGSCLCLKKPLMLDSSGESPTSDPNSPNFTNGMLRSFIEKNDFRDKDCNPHLDDE